MLLSPRVVFAYTQSRSSFRINVIPLFAGGAQRGYAQQALDDLYALTPC